MWPCPVATWGPGPARCSCAEAGGRRPDAALGEQREVLGIVEQGAGGARICGDPAEAGHLAEGVGEVEGMMAELGIDKSVADDLMGSSIRNDTGTQEELESGRSSK